MRGACHYFDECQKTDNVTPINFEKPKSFNNNSGNENAAQNDKKCRTNIEN